MAKKSYTLIIILRTHKNNNTMIKKSRIISILLLISLGTIFTTNLKATKNANGNAFIIGSALAAIWPVYNYYNIQKVATNRQSSIMQEIKSKNGVHVLFFIGLTLGIGWLFKYFFTKKITSNIQGKAKQRLAMLVIQLVVISILSTVILSKEKTANNKEDTSNNNV